MRALSRFTRARDTIVAYLSLFFGAGLSIGANLADTLRIRGPLVDTIDIALAVGPPIAALLVVELFVSQWPRTWSVQSVRWVATLIVGILATIVSWIHIHELLAARGQNPYVAMLWPVAIDGLAIMAMAKLLVTRGHVANVQDIANGKTLGQDLDMASPAGQAGLDNAMANPDSVAIGLDVLASQPDDPTVDVQAELARWQQGYQEAIADQGALLAQETESFLAKAIGPEPVMTDTIKPEAADLIKRMTALNAKAGEIDRAVSDMCDVSTRQARRWRSALRNEEN